MQLESLQNATKKSSRRLQENKRNNKINSSELKGRGHKFPADSDLMSLDGDTSVLTDDDFHSVDGLNSNSLSVRNNINYADKSLRSLELAAEVLYVC